jgi:hypothetical protein
LGRDGRGTSFDDDDAPDELMDDDSMTRFGDMHGFFFFFAKYSVRFVQVIEFFYGCLTKRGSHYGK